MAENPTDISKFMFSLHAADETEKDLNLRCEALRERIGKIIRKMTFADTPFGTDVTVLDYILRMNPTSEELRNLAKVIDRVGPLRDELTELDRRRNLIGMVKENPEAFAALFGDFAADDLDPEMFTSS